MKKLAYILYTIAAILIAVWLYFIWKHYSDTTISTPQVKIENSTDPMSNPNYEGKG